MKIFDGYTLKFDCGRRGSFVGKGAKFLGSNGKHAMDRQQEVLIHDGQRLIVITSNNKPLSSSTIRDALYALSKTSLSKVYFRAYRIFAQHASATASNNPSPYESTLSHSLKSISEQQQQRHSNNHSRMPPARRTKSKKYSQPPPAASSGASAATNMSVGMLPFADVSPRTSASYSATSSSALTPSDTHELTHLHDLSARSTLSISSSSRNRLSGASSGAASTIRFRSGSAASSSTSSVHEASHLRDFQFEELLDILKTCPLQSVVVGEECVSWTWHTVMTVLHYCTHVTHLAVHVGFDRRKLPRIKNQQRWLDFIGLNHAKVANLQSLWCSDDQFLRLMHSLVRYRGMGTQLSFVEKSHHYEQGSLRSHLHRDRDQPSHIKTNMMDDDELDSDGGDALDTLHGHFVHPKPEEDIDCVSGAAVAAALSFMRYRCQFAPDIQMTGVEFDGAQVLEFTPFDGMFVTLPSSCKSLRLSGGGSFYEEPDEYHIVVPLHNELQELCIHDIHNLNHLHGKYHLKHLQNLVIKKRPKDAQRFQKKIRALCEYAPLQRITLMSMSKARKSTSSEQDFWHELQNTKCLTVADHSNVIQVHDTYRAPPTIDSSAVNANLVIIEDELCLPCCAYDIQNTKCPSAAVSKICV
eukprot:CAMPEP_0202729616 /NCGR_PEP_ID=MMETSP1385-20130828/186224_1 /ASSEMBLY_ACC=CAM_ASM_000861 /TAXON_ID=933848 /ORGANISM="Elphidium margaritaceum" /LENGTH=639 /DNA_ID=CAMNT_0049395883 /DNA_START=88 /DNA_END=2008 /DNA_ORIENTATION=+